MKAEGVRGALALVLLFVAANSVAISSTVTALRSAPRSSAVEVQFARASSFEDRRALAMELYRSGAVERVAPSGSDRWSVTTRYPSNFAEVEWVRRIALNARGVVGATSIAGYVMGR